MRWPSKKKPFRLAGEHESEGQPRSSRRPLQFFQRFDDKLGVLDTADLLDELLDGKDLLLGQVRQAGSQGPLEVIELESGNHVESPLLLTVYMSARPEGVLPSHAWDGPGQSAEGLWLACGRSLDPQIRFCRMKW